MQRTRAFRRLLVVMVVLILAGGAGIAASRHFSGSAGASQGPTFAPGLQVNGFSASGPTGSGVTSPQTTLLNVPGTQTETGTITETASTTTETQATLGQLGSSITSTNGAANSSGRSIEFSGSISLQAADPSSGMLQAEQVAYALGGYVGASSYDSSSNGTATVTLMVPTQDFQLAMSRLQALGKVVDLQSGSNDVTVQYTDLNATLASLQTEQASLLRLLSQSNDVNSTIQIESIIEQTDAQMNSVESQIIQTRELVGYASILVTLMTAYKPAAPSPVELKLSATPREGLSPLSVTFDALVSGGAGPYIVNYNFGDGTSSQGSQLIHQFTQAGVYNVTVSATDSEGNASLASVLITVKSPPAAPQLSAFAGSVWSIFSSVIEGIVEVAAVVVPIGLVTYAAVIPLWNRYSRGRQAQQKEEEAQP